MIKSKQTLLARTLEQGLGYIPDKKKEELSHGNSAAILLALKGNNLLRDLKIMSGEVIYFDEREPVTFSDERGRLAIFFTLFIRCFHAHLLVNIFIYFRSIPTDEVQTPIHLAITDGHDDISKVWRYPRYYIPMLG